MKRFYMEVTESGFTYLWVQRDESEKLSLLAIRDFTSDDWELEPSYMPLSKGERASAQGRCWLADTTIKQLHDWSFNLKELAEEEVFAMLL